MKKILCFPYLLILIFLSCGGSSSKSDDDANIDIPVTPALNKDSVALASANWTVTDLGNGAKLKYAEVNMFNSTQSISVLTYSSSTFTTDIAYNRTLTRTSAQAVKANADFAINGSFFSMKEGYPVTFLMVDKVVTDSIKDSSFTGIIVINKTASSCTVDIKTCPYNQYGPIKANYTSALVSGPILLSNGMVPYFTDTARHPRTVIATAKDGTIAMITIDGRLTGYAAGATYAEAGKIARYLKMNNALNMDGGGSTTMWTKNQGVVNYPSDNGKYDHNGERKVSTIIYAVKN
jgi:exopolysaccharide biosynthesis protein